MLTPKHAEQFKLTPKDVEKFTGNYVDPKAVSGDEFVTLRLQWRTAYRLYQRAKFMARSTLKWLERQIVSDTRAESWHYYEETLQKRENSQIWKLPFP